ncbi:hypothetical protein IA57_06375 [Mangrovimonas yunxiaonensis]|uniref:Lipoprotein n=1 Tax=Mangrovimonas yunxiaonensis TaxID=1197477 RepID=A0A084TL65_9FLAO|nr:hypothetical protein [Mangrovimonas yunxiaonensis]KFB01451.1 hypothetical protein IA57_06375 [Mangrovimonas yunxiaonensis]GGH36584.1 hypothetical protein GCM10011364_03980 [Mangrovimonas yunxiaonensis]
MKIFTILVSLFIMNACGSAKTDTPAEAQFQQNKTGQEYVIAYSAVTRGYLLDVKVTPKTITRKAGLNAKALEKPITQQDYQSLVKKIEAIGLANMATLEVPSKDHQFDGALIANLKITTQDTTYQTPSFDHGNPPKAIKTLVEEVLSLSEKVE